MPAATDLIRVMTSTLFLVILFVEIFAARAEMTSLLQQPIPLAMLISDPTDYCDTEDFNPQCPSRDEVLVMQKATYGRMELGRCVSANYGFLTCQGNVIGYLDYQCSGRHNCTMRLPDNALVRRTTCPKEFKMYLTASYYCVPVERSICDHCRGLNQAARIITSFSGYLASSVTDGSHDSRCGSDFCPYRLEVKSGQTINITLYDFGSNKYESDMRNQSIECLVYARIREPSIVREIPVCGERNKITMVYSSVTNIVEIIMSTDRKKDRDGHFLFYYEAVGCPDYVSPERAWAKRYGEKMVVGCNSSTSHKWEVKCVEKQWIGETGSCPVVSMAQVGVISLPLGVLMAIVLGIALVIGVLIVTVGIVYLKRQQREMMYPPGGSNMAYMGHEPYYEVDTLDPETMQPLNTIQRQKQQLEHALTLQKQQQQLLHLHDEHHLRTLDKKATRKLKQAQKRQKRKGRSMSDGGRNVYARTNMESRPLPSIPVIQVRPEPLARLDSAVSMPPQSYSMGSVHPLDYGGSDGLPIQSHPVSMQQQQGGPHTRTNSPVVQIHIPSGPSASATPGPGFGTARRPAKPQRTSSSVKASAAASAISGASMASLASQGPTQHYTMLDPLEVQQLMARLPQNQQQQQPVYPQYHPLQPSPPQQQAQQIHQHQQFPPPLSQGEKQGVDLRPCREGSQPILSDLSVETSSWP